MIRPVVLIAAAVTLPSAGFAQSVDDAPARRADRILEALVEVNGVPGMGAAVWRDGAVVWEGQAGWADLEAQRPVDRDTVFRLASVSKVIAATAAARLAEQGRLDLDAPIQTTLPWLDNDWPDINARQLAAHISGMPHYNDRDRAELGPIHFADTRQAVDWFSDRPLQTPPGEAYSYSSWAYVLIQAQIEAASGATFLDYVAQEVTPGLAVRATTPDTRDPSESIAYELAEDGQVRRTAYWDMSYTWAGGGLAATGPDLATWGGRVLDGEVLSRAMFESQLIPQTLTSGQPAGEDGYQVGFGWRTQTDRDGRRLAHHAGITEGARSALVLYPDQRTSSVILSNAIWVSSITSVAEMLAAPFLPDGEAGQAPCPVEATRYEGRYRGEPIAGAPRFTLADGICAGELTVQGNPLGTRMNSVVQPDVAALPVIGVSADGGLGQAALVTPVGLYDLRISGGMAWASNMAGAEARRLEITLY